MGIRRIDSLPIVLIKEFYEVKKGVDERLALWRYGILKGCRIVELLKMYKRGVCHSEGRLKEPK